MNEDKNLVYVCAVCEESSPRWLTGGLACFGSVAVPILVCPLCGPIHLEVMQMCREAAVSHFLN